MEFDKYISSDTPSPRTTKLDSFNSIATRGGTKGSKLPKIWSHETESLKTFEKSVPETKSSEKKLSWLRSQIIGSDVEFDTPFGKRKLTYADHTASGRAVQYIENFIIKNALPAYGNTHTSDSYVGERTTKMVHEAANYIKKCLGGTKDDALLFCGSGTTAAIKRLQEVMGIAVPSICREKMIKCLKDVERWVVFVGPYEHHSNLLSWRQSLAEVIEIGLDDTGFIDIKALREKLEFYAHANRPLLGSFSACSNVTGLYSDTREIATLLHQYGAFACFDFAASGPYVEIDMRSGEIDGYDAIFLSPHKFIGGPGTPGILLMSKTLYRLGSQPPSTCGGGTVAYVNGFSEEHTLYYDDIEERENGGTPQIIQIIKAALTFWVKEYIGYEVIDRQEHLFIERALKRLLPNKNIWILGNTTAKRQAILSFLIFSTSNSSFGIDHEIGNGQSGLYMWGETGNKKDKPLHGPYIATILNDLFGIQARGGCACAGPYGHSLLGVDEKHSLALRAIIEKDYAGVKPGWTRLSFPYYMSNEEFEFILAALEFIATYGQRFLPLYDFNLRTGQWTFRRRYFKDLLREENNHHSRVLSTLASVLKTENMKVDGFKEKEKDVDVISKYASYLESAMHIATLLPKFPPPRKLEEDVDADLIHYRL